MTFSRTIFSINCMLLTACFISLCSCSSTDQEMADDSTTYVEDACSVTRYHEICVHSLASFSNTAKRDPSKWARAGVSVTITQAKLVSQYLANLQSRNTTRGRNRVALSDCIELFQDTLDFLHGSLDVLRNFTGQDFNSQMEDVISWLSSALTDEDTCLEGFGGHAGWKMKRNHLLQNEVLNSTYMTSNALALVNKLATSGPQQPLKDP
ncbi:hypothetical protein ACH5RR_010790 [Cinchona calisaya]|uniref:Pectinesterase inhibitor domain-containing protein n=1 Tax=Cinchona calisaya TaxID=153742 RepID=A0ABD3AK46_9GENT